ncbi:MAG: Flp/Fap pilin component [bacterium ADurb.Bin478]|nr:MAG: Flp/Fap pilin component [bacterium ADurb.Bin478]
MQAVINFLRGLFSKEEGQTLAEYALILVLIAIAVIAAVTLLGGQIEAVFNAITAALGIGG